MHKSATKCNETIGKWCKNKHGVSKIIDTFETYQGPGLWGSWKCSTTLTVSAVSRHVVARHGAAVRITVPLGNDGTQ
jgi:hypothetical protein